MGDPDGGGNISSGKFLLISRSNTLDNLDTVFHQLTLKCFRTCVSDDYFSYRLGHQAFDLRNLVQQEIYEIAPGFLLRELNELRNEGTKLVGL